MTSTDGTVTDKSLLRAVARTGKRVKTAEARLATVKGLRDEAIREASAAGIGYRRIATQAGLTNMGVKRIVQKEVEE